MHFESQRDNIACELEDNNYSWRKQMSNTRAFPIRLDDTIHD